MDADSESKPSSLLSNDWLDKPDHMHFGHFYFSIPIYFFNDEFDCGKGEFNGEIGVSASVLDLVSLCCLPDLAKTGPDSPTAMNFPPCDLRLSRWIRTPRLCRP